MDRPLVLAREDPSTGDACLLIERLDSELARRYPGSSIHGLDLESIGGGRGAFLVARDSGRAVGCGAVRLVEPGTAEIKRIFVAEEARGRGVAKYIGDPFSVCLEKGLAPGGPA